MTKKGDRSSRIIVRQTRPEDLDQVVELSRKVYPETPWRRDQLESHLRVFPEGQLVAVDTETGRIVGMAASLIIDWDDYEVHGTWMDFTGRGTFENHDPEHGHTLYGAEVMVDPTLQGMGIGKKIYAARRELCRRLGLTRIRAGARLRGYSRYAEQMSPEEYVIKVVRKEIGDPTLSFQLKQRFRVVAVVRDYLWRDPESHGHAAVIEWINHQVAKRRDFAGRDPRFAQRGERSAGAGKRDAAGRSAEPGVDTGGASRESGGQDGSPEAGGGSGAARRGSRETG